MYFHLGRVSDGLALVWRLSQIQRICYVCKSMLLIAKEGPIPDSGFTLHPSSILRQLRPPSHEREFCSQHPVRVNSTSLCRQLHGGQSSQFLDKGPCVDNSGGGGQSSQFLDKGFEQKCWNNYPRSYREHLGEGLLTPPAQCYLLITYLFIHAGHSLAEIPVQSG